jgi:RimJ/RimL family protein N-acetyltransferase
MLAGPMGEPIRSPFEGRLIRLRAVEEHDLGWINREFYNPNVLRFLEIAWPASIGGNRAWWEATRRHDPGPMVIETLDGNEPVGVCALESIEARSRAASAGIWLAEAHWGRGYGTDAMRTLCRFGFRQMNLQRIGLMVYENNPRAKRAYEKVGFVEEGRQHRAHFVEGRYWDVFEMGLLAEELIEDPGGQAS